MSKPKTRVVAITLECNEYLDAIKLKYGTLKGVAIEQAVKKAFPEIAELVEKAREVKK